MSGESFNYKFGRKNQWRRTIHNRIVERLSVPPRDAVVLYLAGEMDLDRAEFIRRGFRPHNLIAVEIDSIVAQSLRLDGKLCLKADLCDVTRNWAKDRVHVLFADLCCGLTDSILEKLAPSIAENPCFEECVCAVNLLRGRDKRGAEVVSQRLGKDNKHRGLGFYMWVTDTVAEIAVTFCEHHKLWKSITSCVKDCSKYPRLALNSRLYTTSYKSPAANQVFDSCVFINRTSTQFVRIAIANNFYRMAQNLDNQQCLNELKEYLAEINYAREIPKDLGILGAALIRLSQTFAGNQSVFDEIRAVVKLDQRSPVARQISAIKARRTMMEQQIA